MDTNSSARPLISESSTSESTNVDVVIGDLRDKILTIPDYQRDGDQWDEPTRSLLIESVINNLTIPAFFFEVSTEGGVERNSVIDGQQRLTTLYEFHERKFRMVSSDEAPYLSPNSVHYAGKTFDELPLPYQQAFKKYRLTIIKLRGLGGMRLEIFRRINQGGTPLSGQDIRLAYYGEDSPSVTFVRLAGIYDRERPAAQRFLDKATSAYHLDFPWTDDNTLEAWRDWWEDKELARGQTASEMFLWSLVSAQVEQLNDLLQNTDALAKLNCRFNRAIDEALDACCAQLRYQDTNSSSPALLMSGDEIAGKFFPHFQSWFGVLIGRKGISLPVSKHRIVASLIGAAYRVGVAASALDDAKWTQIVEFVRRPQECAKRVSCEWPVSKGRWDGKRGYRTQFKCAEDVLRKFVT